MTEIASIDSNFKLNSNPSTLLSSLFHSASILTGQADSTLTFPSLKSRLKGKGKSTSDHSHNQLDSLKTKLSIRLEASISQLDGLLTENLLKDEEVLQRLNLLDASSDKVRQKAREGRKAEETKEGTNQERKGEKERNEAEDPFFQTGFQALLLLLQINQAIQLASFGCSTGSDPSTSTSSNQSNQSSQQNQDQNQNNFGSRDLKSVSILCSLVFQFLVRPIISNYDCCLDLETLSKRTDRDESQQGKENDEELSQKDGFSGPRFQEIEEETLESREESKLKMIERIKGEIKAFKSNLETTLESLNSICFLLFKLLPSRNFSGRTTDHSNDSKSEGILSEWEITLQKYLISPHLSDLLDLGLRISFGPGEFPVREYISLLLKREGTGSLCKADRKTLMFSSREEEKEMDETKQRKREADRMQAGQSLKLLMNNTPTLSLLSALSSRFQAQSTSTLNPSDSFSSRSSSKTRAHPGESNPRAPDFISGIKRHFLSAQLLRKDGVKSLMEASGLNLQGEETASSTKDHDNGGKEAGGIDNETESSVLKKMVSISNLVQIPPNGLSEDTFIDIILSQLFKILGFEKQDVEETGKGKTREKTSLDNQEDDPKIQSPPSFVRCAVFCLVRISESRNDKVGSTLEKWFWDSLWSSFNPKITQVEDSILIASSKLFKGLELLSKILENVEPSPNFITGSLINEKILPQLFSLLAFVERSSSLSRRNPTRGVASPKVQDILEDNDPRGDQDSRRNKIRKEVSRILKDSIRIWMRLVDKTEGGISIGLKANGLTRRLLNGGIGEIKIDDDSEEKIKGDIDDENNEEKLVTYWHEDEDGSISIKLGRQSTPDSFNLSDLLSSLPSQVQIPKTSNPRNAADGAEEEALPEIPNSFLDSLSLDPDPKLLSKFLKDSRRLDLAHSLLLEVLDAYVGYGREKKRLGGGGNGLDKKPILYLQLILQLFDSFGSEILHSDKFSPQSQDDSDDKIGKSNSVLAFINFALGEKWNEENVDDHPEEAFEAGANPKVLISSLDSDEGLKEDVGSKTALEGLMDINQIKGSQNKLSDDTNGSRDEIGKEADEEVDGDLVETALTLLLALLEGDQHLNAKSAPLLLVISSKISSSSFLEIKHGSEFKQLVKEARLVLTARLSSMENAQESGKDKASESLNPNEEERIEMEKRKSKEVYQEALRLLQDPILPVRAHGLILLKDLISNSNGTNNKGDAEDSKPKIIEEALIPSILSIFLQAIQDDESYLYLNAVQGLAELGLRKENSTDRKMLESLLDIYVGREKAGGWGREDSKLAKKSSAKHLSQNEADMRLRVGEALTIVIQRCGDRLSSLALRLVSPLLTALRDPTAPTTFKSSIISVLGTCVEAFPVAIASSGLNLSLASTSVELLRIETVAREKPGRIPEKVKRKSTKRNKSSNGNPNQGKKPFKVTVGNEDSESDFSPDSSSEGEEEEGKKEKKPVQDSAVSTDSKLPHLRRSAVLLLKLLVRGTRDQIELHSSRIQVFNNQRINFSKDEHLNQILNHSATEEKDGSSISSLRLPNGSVLSVPSIQAKSPSKEKENTSSTSSSIRSRPPTLGSPLFPLEFIPSSKQLMEYLSFRDNDELVRATARDLLGEIQSLELDCLTDAGMEWIREK